MSSPRVAFSVKPGDRIVARGLPVNRTSKANRLPPSIALVVHVDRSRVLIRLRVGSFGGARARFSPGLRECRFEDVARHASPREVVTGDIDP